MKRKEGRYEISCSMCSTTGRPGVIKGKASDVTRSVTERKLGVESMDPTSPIEPTGIKLGVRKSIHD
jgi:hypothetical protein